MPDLSNTGTTVSTSDWMTPRGPEAKLDAQDGANLEAVDIRRQQIFNPKVMGSTAMTAAWKTLHAGLTLEAGVRLKNHGGDSDSIFIGVAGATTAGAADEHGFELRPGEELFLEVNNLGLVSRYGTAGGTLSYIAT